MEERLRKVCYPYPGHLQSFKITFHFRDAERICDVQKITELLRDMLQGLELRSATSQSCEKCSEIEVKDNLLKPVSGLDLEI